MAKPTYTPEQAAEVLIRLEEGQTYKSIAEAMGLKPTTVDAIRRKGKAKRFPSPPSEPEIPSEITAFEYPGLTPFQSWLHRWENAYKAAETKGNTTAMISLLSQYATRLVEKQQTEPITVIQPVEYSYILPAVRLDDLAHNICEAAIDVIKAQAVSIDDAQRLLNCLSKQFPALTPQD
jgi:hypothetical protein